MNEPLTRLCLEHLHQEEALLQAALAVVGAIQNGFGAHGLDAYAAALDRHRELVGMVGDIQCRRREFARVTTAYIGGRREDVTVAGVLAFLGVDKETMPPCLAETLARVRDLAHELAAANYVVSVHVRVHLDAYRRILRDLTNTRDGPGRYGRAGQPETLEYRPMLQIGA